MSLLRAVVDVNVVVSGLITSKGAPAEVLTAVEAGDLTMIVSPTYLAELHDVLYRPKFRRWFSASAASRAFEEVRRGSESLDDAQEQPAVTRDRKDDYLVHLARNASADFLVTGDADLHEANLSNVRVVSPAGVLQELHLASLTKEHFIYATRETDADALSVALAARGVLHEVRPSCPAQLRWHWPSRRLAHLRGVEAWLVTAYTGMIDEEQRRFLEDAVVRHNCRYDGSGTYLGPVGLLATDEGRQ